MIEYIETKVNYGEYTNIEGILNGERHGVRIYQSEPTDDMIATAKETIAEQFNQDYN